MAILTRAPSVVTVRAQCADCKAHNLQDMRFGEHLLPGRPLRYTCSTCGSDRAHEIIAIERAENELDREYARDWDDLARSDSRIT